MKIQEAIDTILGTQGPVSVVMRGCSGSGKSTFVTTLQEKYGKEIESYSTDSRRYQNGKYIYKPEDNSLLHGQNLRSFTEALFAQAPIVVCDNTNTTLLEFGVYCQISVAFNYTPFVVTMCNNENLEENAKRNLHGVPLNSIINQYINIEKFDKQIKKQWNPLWVKE